MSLQARLTLFFIVIVVVPVTAVTAYGWSAVARTAQRQVRSELELARASTQVAFENRLERARDAVVALARDRDLPRAMAARDTRQVQAVLHRHSAADLLLAVTAPDARVLGRGGHTGPAFLPGTRQAPLGMLLPREPGKVVSWPMLQRHSADLRARGCRGPLRRCLLGTVTAGVWLDNQELQRLARATPDADLTLVIGDVPVASTIGRLTADDRVPAANGIRRGQLAGRQVVVSTEPLTSEVGEQARLLISIPATPTTAGIDSRLLAIVLLGLVVVCLVATLLGSVLARLVSRPLGELAEQARAIARGDFASPRRGSAPAARVGGAGPRLRAHAGRAGRVPDRPPLQPRRAGPLHEPAGRDPVLDPRPAQAAVGGAGGGRPGPAGQGGQPAAAHPRPDRPGP